MEVAYIVEVTILVKYVTRKKDPLIQIVRICQTHHRQKPHERITERNKATEGHHSREDKGEMVREEDTWAVPT